MKTSTLNKIAREIQRATRINPHHTVDQMHREFDRIAAGNPSQREAAYLIATQIFDLVDEEDEDRRTIDSILAGIDGEWQPCRAAWELSVTDTKSGCDWPDFCPEKFATEADALAAAPAVLDAVMREEWRNTTITISLIDPDGNGRTLAEIEGRGMSGHEVTYRAI